MMIFNIFITNMQLINEAIKHNYIQGTRKLTYLKFKILTLGTFFSRYYQICSVLDELVIMFYFTLTL